ncbi:Ankyrin repeat, partial [Musa troglodytarum]
VSPLVGLISAHTANFLAFNQVCITAAFVSRSSTTAHRAEMGDPGAASRRKNRFPKGGSESSVLHAAARNGDLTTVESICNANPLAVNSRDRHSRTPICRASSLLRHREFGTEFLGFRGWAVELFGGGARLINGPRGPSEGLRRLGRCRRLSRTRQHATLRRLRSGWMFVTSSWTGSGDAGLSRSGLQNYPRSHLELIEYLVRKGASVTAMTKAGQTPIDRVSTDEVRALLVKSKQPLTKDDKSTTIMEVGDSVSKEHIKENNGGSVAEEAANVDEEGVDTKEKRRGEAAAEDSSKPRKAKVSLGHLLAENDLLDEDEEQDADTKGTNHISASLVLKL